MIYIGADHRGFELKTRLYKRLVDQGYQVTDLGNDHLDPSDDYVDFAAKVGEAVVGDLKNRGILLCGSGVGVDIAANKLDGVRSALVDDVKKAQAARNDDNANVLSLPADSLDEETAFEIIKVFLDTDFSGEERYQRRIEKVEELEKSN